MLGIVNKAMQWQISSSHPYSTTQISATTLPSFKAHDVVNSARTLPLRFSKNANAVQKDGLKEIILLANSKNLIKVNISSHLLVAILFLCILLTWISVAPVAMPSSKFFGSRLTILLQWLCKCRVDGGKNLRYPPIIQIPREIQLSEKGHDAYAKALDDNGNSVVVIPRHGRMEYVIDHRFAKDVLTDSTNYSFEKAVTNMLHMEFMLWFKQGTFVQELDKLVQDGVIPRLQNVVEEIIPIFAQEAKEIHQNEVHLIDNTYEWIHKIIAQAMVIVILGPQYSSKEMVRNFMEIVGAIANLSGIYENTKGWKWFPKLWSLKTTFTAITFTIIPRFFFSVLPILWRNRKDHLNAGKDVNLRQFAPFFDLLTAKHKSQKKESISFLNFVWCATICLGIIFASIHQTAVVASWCITTLSQKQDEYLDELRQEWDQIIDTENFGEIDNQISIEKLKKLTKLDSFIREVMRTKGDTFAPVRYTTKDVQVGQYIIPKNSLCAPYVKRAHEHKDNYGQNGSTFDGFQWHYQNKSAIQGGHDFIAFGLGRWACPGRQLAIAEIKLIMLTLFAQNDVSIDSNSFKITDPMNTTSVAPEAVLKIKARK